MRELFGWLEHVINKGNNDMYKIAHGGLLTTIDKCTGNINKDTRLQIFVQPPTKIKSRACATLLQIISKNHC